MDIALDRAVRVFRERGYHATSIGDLTTAMRLATGSIYKAFRDKHAVFLAAFERYTSLRQEQTRSAAACGTNGRTAQVVTAACGAALGSAATLVQ